MLVARLWFQPAVFALLSLSAFPPVSGGAAPPEQAYVIPVLVRSETAHKPLFLNVMQEELETVFARAGFRLAWLDARSPRESAAARESITLQLGNLPDESSGAASRTLEIPLGYTRIVRGEIQPYCGVDLEAIRATIEIVAPSMLEPLRSVYLGRAAARVAAHELYHVLTRSAQHGRRGLAAPVLTSRDLIYGSADFAAEDVRLMRANWESSAPERSGGEQGPLARDQHR